MPVKTRKQKQKEDRIQTMSNISSTAIIGSNPVSAAATDTETIDAGISASNDHDRAPRALSIPQWNTLPNSGSRHPFLDSTYVGPRIGATKQKESISGELTPPPDDDHQKSTTPPRTEEDVRTEQNDGSSLLDEQSQNYQALNARVKAQSIRLESIDKHFGSLERNLQLTIAKQFAKLSETFGVTLSQQITVEVRRVLEQRLLATEENARTALSMTTTLSDDLNQLGGTVQHFTNRIKEVDSRLRPLEANVETLVRNAPTPEEISAIVREELSHQGQREESSPSLEYVDPPPTMNRESIPRTMSPRPSIGHRDPKRNPLTYGRGGTFHRREDRVLLKSPVYERRETREPSQTPRFSVERTYEETEDESSPLNRQIHECRRHARTALLIEPEDGEKPLRLGDLDHHYHGSSDYDEFMSFLKSLMRHLEGSLLTGQSPSRKRKQLIVFANALRGSALDWYNDMHDDMELSDDLESVLVLMLQRFVSVETIFKAAKEYEELTFSRDKGVHGLYLDIEKLARKMIEPPSEHDKCRKFLAELPEKMRSSLMTDEKNRSLKDLKRLKDIAVNYDSGVKLSETLGATSQATSRRRISTPSRAPVDRRRPIANPASNPHPQPPIRTSSFPKTNPSSTAATKAPSSSSNRFADYLCHSCHTKGHIASNPICPNFSQGNNRRFTAVAPAVDEALEPPSEEDVEREIVSTWNDEENEGGSLYQEAQEDWSRKDDVDEQSTDEEDDEYGSNDRTLRLGSMRIQPMRSEYRLMRTDSSNDPSKKVQRTNLRHDSRASPKNRPTSRSDGENLPLTALILIQGVKAFALFDSGCTTNIISSDFVRVAGMKTHKLDEPLILQLGMRGSKSNIFHETKSDITFGNMPFKDVSFDVGNVDRYDSTLR